MIVGTVSEEERGRMTVRRFVASILAVSLSIEAAGCGTIFQGTHQKVPVAVSPAGTEVAVYRWSGEVVGGPQISPGELSAERPKWHQPYLVRASKAGYCPKYWLTTDSPTGASWIYIWMVAIPLLGTVVGLTLGIVDSATGGCCNIEPDSFEGTLAEEGTCTP